MNLKEIGEVRKAPEEIFLEKSTIKSLQNLHLYASHQFHHLGKLIEEKQKEKKDMADTLDLKRIDIKINYLHQQRKSLAERGRVAYWLSSGLRNYLNHPHQQHEVPKIIPVEEDGKVTLRLSAGKKWLKFGEETFISLLEIFYPGNENTLEHRTLKDLVFKEKREIVLKI
jgi:hypothetical protein